MGPMGNPSLRFELAMANHMGSYSKNVVYSSSSAIYAQYAAARSPNDGNRAEHADRRNDRRGRKDCEPPTRYDSDTTPARADSCTASCRDTRTATTPQPPDT